MTIQLRRDTAANWASVNPVLAAGQPGYDTTNKILKIGDGTTAWAALPSLGGGGGTSDHGALTGLSDDDHPQYLNNSRGDARYPSLTTYNAAISALNSGKFNVPTGDTTQYIAGDGTLIAFPVAGQAGTLVRQVRNETGSTLPKGAVVYVSGASGNKPVVSLAIANADSTSAQTFGVVQADISNNSNGYVVVKGDLIGIDTSAFADGAQLYLSGTTAGAVTATKPVAPIHMVYVGVVTRSHATQGQIEVGIQNGFELDEIHDLLILDKTDRDVPSYDGASGLWKNKQLTASDISNFNAATDARIKTAIDPLRNYIESCDFQGAGSSSTGTIWAGGGVFSGSTTNPSVAQLVGAIGAIVLTSSTSANSGQRFQTSSNIDVSPDTSTRLRFQLVESAGLANTKLVFGFTNTITRADSTHEVVFIINGTSVTGVCRNASVATTTTTLGTITHSVWYGLKIDINSAGNAVTFSIYTATGTPIASETITTNIPLENSVLRHGVIATNSGTTALSLCVLDYMDLSFSKSNRAF